jgi:ribosome recycling factor
MEPQAIINLAGGSLLAVMGWFARQLWDAVRELRQDLHRIEMDLPSNYMRRDDFREGMKEIKALFGEVFKKIDDLKEKKADK